MSKQTDKIRQEAGSLRDQITAALDATGYLAGLSAPARQRLEDAKDGLLRAFLDIKETAEEPLMGSTANLQKGLSFVKESAIQAVGGQKTVAEETMKSGGRRAASFVKRRAVPVGAGALAIGVVAAILFAWMRLGRRLSGSALTGESGPDAGSRETPSNGRRTWDAPSMAAQVGRIS